MADFKKSLFDILQDYIHEGATASLTDDETAYLDVLYLLNNMRRKYGRNSSVAFISGPPLNIAHKYAARMYDEAINLFYADDGIGKKARRNMLADDLEAAAALVMETSKTPADLKIYGELMEKACKVRGLNEPEPPVIPEALYRRQVKVYSLDPATIGLPKADRRKLAERIDNLDIPEREKARLRVESEVEDINFIELFDEQEKTTGQ